MINSITSDHQIKDNRLFYHIIPNKMGWKPKKTYQKEILLKFPKTGRYLTYLPSNKNNECYIILNIDAR